MFGLGKGKVKNALLKTISNCLEPLKDELGNVPIAMQTDKAINAYILGICETYAIKNNITKTQSVALIVDAVFEEIFRREATEVLILIDNWRQRDDQEFFRAYSEAQEKINNTADLDINWFQDYANNNFEPARNLML